jgi:large subunit ribosomal protein L23
MEAENKLIFVVDRKSSKGQIKKSIEEMFKVKVLKVSTFITAEGEKRAYIKLSSENPAIDIATQLGLM